MDTNNFEHESGQIIRIINAKDSKSFIFKCNFCQETFVKVGLFMSHIKKNHNTSASASVTEDEPKKCNKSVNKPTETSSSTVSEGESNAKITLEPKNTKPSTSEASKDVKKEKADNLKFITNAENILYSAAVIEKQMDLEKRKKCTNVSMQKQASQAENKDNTTTDQPHTETEYTISSPRISSPIDPITILSFIVETNKYADDCPDIETKLNNITKILAYNTIIMLENSKVIKDLKGKMYTFNESLKQFIKDRKMNPSKLNISKISHDPSFILPMFPLTTRNDVEEFNRMLCFNDKFFSQILLQVRHVRIYKSLRRNVKSLMETLFSYKLLLQYSFYIPACTPNIAPLLSNTYPFGEYVGIVRLLMTTLNFNTKSTDLITDQELRTELCGFLRRTVLKKAGVRRKEKKEMMR